MSQQRHRNIRWPVACVLVLSFAGCTDFGGTQLHMTLNAGVLASADGEHYELFATVNGSAVSLKRFIIQNEPSSAGLAVKTVLDFDPPYSRLGVTDSLDSNGLLQGGISFRLPLDLSSATEVFATIELDGESDPAPSRTVVFQGTLRAVSRGTISAILVDSVLSSVRRTNTELGTITLVLPDDGINGL